jgi:site-specific recombinase XerD
VTTRAIIPVRVHAGLATVARELVVEAAQNTERVHAPATRRAYAADWAAFEGWCRGFALEALPASEATLCTYFTHLSHSHKYATIQRAWSAIRVRHEDAGHPIPPSLRIKNTFKALAVKLGTRPEQKKALEFHEACAAVDKLPTTPRGIRDRAILLFGELFAGRRAEIAALEVRDLAFSQEGVKVTLRRSKTDQEGRGRVVAVHRRESHCPVQALEAWLSFANLDEGPVFRAVYGMTGIGAEALTPETIANVVKRAAASIGLDQRDYAGHSTRRGFVTTSAKQGESFEKIMMTTGHKNFSTVKRYVDEANPFAHAVKVK